MDISREVIQAFDWMGFKELTAIQQKCIPLMMDGHDIIAIAPTGTGKTLGFGIPMLEYVNLDQPTIQEVVLAPTRELAQQIADELTTLAHFIKPQDCCDLWRPALWQANERPFPKAADPCRDARSSPGSYAAWEYQAQYRSHYGA